VRLVVVVVVHDVRIATDLLKIRDVMSFAFLTSGGIVGSLVGFLLHVSPLNFRLTLSEVRPVLKKWSAVGVSSHGTNMQKCLSDVEDILRLSFTEMRPEQWS
jgi:hypothetical protein